MPFASMKLPIAVIACAVATTSCQTVDSIAPAPGSLETFEVCSVHSVNLVEVNGFVFDTPNPPSLLPDYAKLTEKFPHGIPFGHSLRPNEYTPIPRTFSYCPVCEHKISEGIKKLRHR